MHTPFIDVVLHITNTAHFSDNLFINSCIWLLYLKKSVHTNKKRTLIDSRSCFLLGIFLLDKKKKDKHEKRRKSPLSLLLSCKQKEIVRHTIRRIIKFASTSLGWEILNNLWGSVIAERWQTRVWGILGNNSCPQDGFNVANQNEIFYYEFSAGKQ